MAVTHHFAAFACLWHAWWQLLSVVGAIQGVSKRGMDVTYLGSGSSVLAVAGQCNQGGNIVIWDTRRPLTSGPVARLAYHLPAVTTLKVRLHPSPPPFHPLPPPPGLPSRECVCLCQHNDTRTCCEAADALCHSMGKHCLAPAGDWHQQEQSQVTARVHRLTKRGVLTLNQNNK